MRKRELTEKRQTEADTGAVISGSEHDDLNGDHAQDEDNRRSGMDRRNFHYTACIPERRSGKERRH